MTVAQLPPLKMCKHSSCSTVATSSNGYCISHQSYSRLKSYSASPKPSRSCKNPMGVELEMYNPASTSYLAAVAPYVCSDGSLPSGGGEIKLCADADKLGRKAADVVQRARIAGAKVNTRCGFHVHMNTQAIVKDRPNNVFRSTIWQNKAAKFALAIQDYFFSLVPPSRQNNMYCRKLEDTDSMRGHHHWICFSSRVPTIEIRIHPGTTNPWKVMAWIDVCNYLQKAFVDVCNDTTTDNVDVSKYRDFHRTLPVNSLAYKYLRARLESPSLARFGFY